MRRGSRSVNASRNISGTNTPSLGSSSHSTTPAPMAVGSSRIMSSARLMSQVPADVIRSTILSLVSQMRISDDKRRSLIVEIQQSDFHQAPVVEYFIGVVGVNQYESALSEISKRSFGAGSSVPDDSAGAQVTAGDKGKLLAKIYCHGGDVAFFGDIDLEFESQINKALLGYSSSSQKKRRINQETLGGRNLPDLSFAKVEQTIKRALHKRGSYSFNPRYVASIQRCICLMLMSILNLTSDIRATTTSPPIDAELISIESVLPKPRSGSSGIKLTHLLSAIQTLVSADRLPVNLTRDWEPLIINKLITLAQKHLGI
jgi:hypothetical protein